MYAVERSLPVPGTGFYAGWHGMHRYTLRVDVLLTDIAKAEVGEYVTAVGLRHDFRSERSPLTIHEYSRGPMTFAFQDGLWRRAS